METKIYSDYIAFLNREDKESNGVTQAFADTNLEYITENESNKGCWNCSGCSGCSGCSYCSDCSGCSGCSGCSDCSYLKDVKVEKPTSENIETAVSDQKAFIVPVIENIHQKVLEAVTPPEHTLKMDAWHTCGTTHCRAGWVVHLAGKAGYLLEKQTDTAFAAMQIYKASSPIRVSPVRFYDDNEVAFKDIERCAHDEITAQHP